MVIPVFAGFTGLNLEDDIIDWMTADYAIGARVLPVNGPLTVSLDAALVTTATDERAADVVTHLTEAAESFDLSYETESIGAGEALVMPYIMPFLLQSALDLPPEVVDNDALDLMVAADDEVFAMGSRPGVNFALTGDGDSLRDNPVFAYAETVFLDDATTVLYISPTDIAAALPALAEAFAPFASPNEVEGVQALLAQVESLTISASTPDDASAILRLTLTLPQDVPYTFPEPEIGSVETVIIEILGNDTLSVARNNGLRLLVTAIEEAGLSTAFTDDTPVTLFAPTDGAVVGLLDTFGLTAEEFLAAPELAPILSYHVLDGVVFQRRPDRRHIRDIERLFDSSQGAGRRHSAAQRHGPHYPG